MAGWFDWISPLTGTQNPYDEARDYQRRANLQNAVAISPEAAQGGIDPGVGPPGPPMGAPPGQPGGPPVARGPTPPTVTGQDPQQPQAYSTPKDLGSIMLDLQQYNERSQGLNQALGAGFAAMSQPRDREWVSHIFNTNFADPRQLGESLMK